MVTASSLLLAVALALGTDPGVAPGNGASLPAPSSRPPGVPGPVPTSSTEVSVGDPAPDFSYRSFDGQWRRLTDLRAQGPILLVFGPDTKELRSIQTERDLLLDLGVVPLAICDVAPHTAFGLVRDLHLGFSVLADPRHIIAEQFNAIDGGTLATVPAWFVIDETGRVRAMGHGVFPPGGYAPLASRALGIPLPGEPRPASTR
jgi:peroxiredoxin